MSADDRETGTEQHGDGGSSNAVTLAIIIVIGIVVTVGILVAFAAVYLWYKKTRKTSNVGNSAHSGCEEPSPYCSSISPGYSKAVVSADVPQGSPASNHPEKEEPIYSETVEAVPHGSSNQNQYAVPTPPPYTPLQVNLACNSQSANRGSQYLSEYIHLISTI